MGNKPYHRFIAHLEKGIQTSKKLVFSSFLELRLIIRSGNRCQRVS